MADIIDFPKKNDREEFMDAYHALEREVTPMLGDFVYDFCVERGVRFVNTDDWILLREAMISLVLRQRGHVHPLTNTAKQLADMFYGDTNADN